MSAESTDHVVIQGDVVRCLHCGRSYRMNLPASITVVVAVVNAFGEDHTACEPSPAVAAADKQRLDESFATPEAWIAGPDTGTSSITIWSVMTGRRPPGRNACLDIPYDPDDFGRCYRLLQAFPAWRARLPEVAAKYPAWAPLVHEWDRMTALYERDLPTGRCQDLYDLMQQLHKETP